MRRSAASYVRPHTGPFHSENRCCKNNKRLLWIITYSGAIWSKQKFIRYRCLIETEGSPCCDYFAWLHWNENVILTNVSSLAILAVDILMSHWNRRVAMLWLLCMATLKWKCHFDECFITGYTGSWHFNVSLKQKGRHAVTTLHGYTEMKMSFWRMFHHWLYWQLTF